MKRLVHGIGARATLLAVLLSFPFSAAAEPGTPRPEPEAYLLHCSGCHRRDGRGIPGVAPDLRKIGVLLGLEGGRRYLGRVPGVAQAPLEDAALARLLNWVLAEIADTPPDPVYSAEEMKILRAEPLRDPLAARSELFARHP